MEKFNYTYLIVSLLLMGAHQLLAQQGILQGRIVNEDGAPLPFVSVGLKEIATGSSSDNEGYFRLKPATYGTYTLVVSAIGYRSYHKKISLNAPNIRHTIRLIENTEKLDEVVITGTMREVSKLESPVPVDVYSAFFFTKNPTPSLFESLQTVNGVRPQLNCNICNTGDIHINGLEGPYTMITIDGMPIVSGLSTVYGLNGIPNSLIERMEIVKGPASTLYGSEAVGGLINIITKSPVDAPLFSADVFTTSWLETNLDLGMKVAVGQKASSLLGINVFNYDNPIDNNGDDFTDLTIAKRISVFNKWGFKRRDNRIASLAARFIYEDRWGGEMNWTKAHRGGNELYGESIFTTRYETLGSYQLPVPGETLMLSFSASLHHQNSFYGNTPYFANQNIGFGQLIWDKNIASQNNLLTGLGMRYTYYDDNTTATLSTDSLRNEPSRIYLPGIFIQNEHKFDQRHTLLSGIRYDFNSIHGHILTPRLNYKFATNTSNILRLSFGTGYRVANVFTEDHAALTGARDVLFEDELKPEKSFNVNLNYTKTIQAKFGIVDLDATAFYTFFTNKIQPDYDTNPNQIIYRNLNGHAVSRGLSLNADLLFEAPLTAKIGLTALNIFTVEKDNEGNDVKERPVLAESFNGTWTITYKFRNNFSIDYSGNIYGPMRLPVLGPGDPRSAYSPVFSIQNIQLSKTLNNGFTIYGGIKNLLNFTPPANAIARSHDPFDDLVEYDNQGSIVPTRENPGALTFDPNYVFASNQGIRGFIGVKYTFK